MLLHAAWERFAPLVEEVGFVLVGRQRRYAFRFRPIGAASCADRLVLGQAAHQEDGRDLTAEPVRVNQLGKRLAIGGPAQPAKDLLEAEVEQQAALRGRARP